MEHVDSLLIMEGGGDDDDDDDDENNENNERTMPLEITMNAQNNLQAVEVHPIHTLNQRQTGADVGNANQWLRI